MTISKTRRSTIRALRTGLRHPSLVVARIRGEEGPIINKRHIALELKRARVVYDNLIKTGANVDEMIRAFVRWSCFSDDHLYPICRWLRPDVVVETGVAEGVSTAFCLQALHDNDKGHLYSIDLPNARYSARRLGDELRVDNTLPTGETTGHFVPNDLQNRWTLILGDATTELPALLKKLGTIDLFHHDSAHTYEQMTFEFETAWRNLRSGGVLASDDVDWNSAFGDFGSKMGVQPHVIFSVGFAVKTDSQTL